MPSVKMYHSIRVDNKEIGKIQIINYGTPHIEYDIDPQWQNKGIMTKELTSYLGRIKDLYPALIAVTEKQNKASIRVLEKTGFFLFKSLRHYLIYLKCFDKKKKEIIQDMLEKSLEWCASIHVK